MSNIKRKRKVPSRFSTYSSVSVPSNEPTTPASASPKNPKKALTLPILSALLQSEVNLDVEFDMGVTLRLLERADLDAMPVWVTENLTAHLCSCMAVNLSKMKERNFWYIEELI